MASNRINRQAWAWSIDTGDAASKLVLLFLAERADGTDFLAWPKTQTIAEATGLSVRTVKDRLLKLVEAGIIEDSMERKGCTKRTKVWRLLVEENDEKSAAPAPLNGANVAPLNGAALAPLEGKECSSRTIKGANVAPLNGAALAPSYIEHSIRDHSIGTQVTPPADADVVPAPKKVAPTTEVWNAYSDAYRARYQTDPIRNAKVNAQLKKLVEMVGLERAIRIAANFPFHPDAFYIKQMHPVGLMLTDCQKLNTELETGQVMTWQRAKQQERIGSAKASVQTAQTAVGDVSFNQEERF